jgi:hypothetical protein
VVNRIRINLHSSAGRWVGLRRVRRHRNPEHSTMVSGGPLAPPVVLFATRGCSRTIARSVLIELWTLHTKAAKHTRILSIPTTVSVECSPMAGLFVHPCTRPATASQRRDFDSPLGLWPLPRGAAQSCSASGPARTSCPGVRHSVAHPVAIRALSPRQLGVVQARNDCRSD